MADRVMGKKCLIYGGGTGIGLACTETLVREGSAVFISSRRTDVLEKADTGLAKIGKAGFAPGDATSVADVQRVTAATGALMDGIDRE